MVTMSNRTRHTGLWFLAGLGVLAAVVIAIAGYLLPVTVTGILPSESAQPRSTKPTPQSANQIPASSLPTLASYDPIWRLQLRPVVKDIAPPPQRPTQPVAPPPPPSMPFTAKLTGTILEAQHSMALFTTQSGDIQFVSIGQMIEDAKVVQIESEKVILDRNGQTLTLEMTEAPVSNQPTPVRPNIYNRRRPIP